MILRRPDMDPGCGKHPCSRTKGPGAKNGGASPFPAPIGSPKTTAAPKAGAKAGAPEAATSEVCLLPEIANAPR